MRRAGGLRLRACADDGSERGDPYCAPELLRARRDADAFSNPGALRQPRAFHPSPHADGDTVVGGSGNAVGGGVGNQGAVGA